MLGDTELIAVGVSAVLWAAGLVALLARRQRAARGLMITAAMTTIGTLALLWAGIGHRA